VASSAGRGTLTVERVWPDIGEVEAGDGMEVLVVSDGFF
jgi:hypothetical protein